MSPNNKIYESNDDKKSFVKIVISKILENENITNINQLFDYFNSKEQFKILKKQKGDKKELLYLKQLEKDLKTSSRLAIRELFSMSHKV